MTTQRFITCGLIAPPGFNKFCRNIAESSEQKLRSSIEFYGLDIKPWGDDIEKGRQAVLDAISLWTWEEFAAAVEKYRNYRMAHPRCNQTTQPEQSAEPTNSDYDRYIDSLLSGEIVEQELFTEPPMQLPMQSTAAQRDRIRAALLKSRRTAKAPAKLPMQSTEAQRERIRAALPSVKITYHARGTAAKQTKK
jgi:hypothetical protein